jgi:hypothetical protein
VSNAWHHMWGMNSDIYVMHSIVSSSYHLRKPRSSTFTNL